MKIIEYLKHRLTAASDRSKSALSNILLSLVGKSISVVSPLLIVPLTIDYVNPTQYGIWLTLSSIVAWISIFDLGLGNGLRNFFAESVAKNNDVLAKQYVSTTYVIITVIVLIIFSIMAISNCFVDWSKILNIEPSYKHELRLVMALLCGFFCFSMVNNLLVTIMSAKLQIGLASLINGLCQLCSLLAIYILTKTSTGSLSNLAIYYSGVPCLVMLISSFIAFNFTSYRKYAPSIFAFRKELIKDILSLGVQFFIIHIAIILIFQIINVVLSRELGPIAVTQYNVAQKYFGIINSIMVVITVPFWSAFTEAYTQQDFIWMKSTVRKLELLWVGFCIIGLLMLAVSSWFYNIWIGDSVFIPIGLSVSMLLFMLSQTLEGIYIYLINGIGKIRIQLIIYVVFGLIAFPLLVLGCRLLGIYGALIIPTLTYFVLAIIGKIQIKKLLSNTATGIWNK